MNDREDPEAERRAHAALDAYLETFNARDWPANAATLHFPHVRITQAGVRVWSTAREYADGNAERIATTFERGWHRSTFHDREVIHSSADKVHVKLRFSRYDADDRLLGTYRTLWIVTRQGDRWGIQARSTFAA